MTVYVTSDLHFGHSNIMKYCPKTRGHFTDVHHMNETMINDWNNVVTHDDLVYILGDVAFLPSKDAIAIMHRLNGRKILIEGNHDRKLLNDRVFRRCFEEIHTYHTLTHNSQKIVMFHFPIFDHDGAGRGSIMLHGHRHGNLTNIPGRIMDVGYDATGNIVTSLDKILEKMQNIQHMYHHQREEKHNA